MNKYTFQQLFDKYHLYPSRGGDTQTKIHYLELRGIKIKDVTPSDKRTKQFIIIDDTLFNKEWVPHPYLPYELTKDGLVRNKEDKKILTPRISEKGYVDVYNHRLHRLIMQTFKPIDNDNNYVVDHINGIRTDNRLENLRWVFLEQNNQFKNINQTEIGAEIARLIQLYGYDKLLILLKNL